MHFLDLHLTLNGLNANTTNGRLKEALTSRDIPPVSVTGIGGFPIRKAVEGYTLLGAPVTPERIREGVCEALGASAVLTHMNPKHRSVEELGARCLQDGHTWALHALPVTLCFAGHGPFVEMSFNRDGSFMQGGSWVEGAIEGMPEGGRIFTMNGSVKAWKRYLGFKDDPSFLKPQREALAQGWAVMHWLLGEDIFPA